MQNSPTVPPWIFPVASPRLRVRKDAGSVATARVFGKHHWATNLTQISVSKVGWGRLNFSKGHLYQFLDRKRTSPWGKLWWIAGLSSGGCYVYLFLFIIITTLKNVFFQWSSQELKFDEGKNRRKLPHKASLTNPASSGKWRSWSWTTFLVTKQLVFFSVARHGECVFWQQRGVSATRTIYVFNGFQARRFGEMFFFLGVWDPVQNGCLAVLAIIWFGTTGFHFCTFKERFHFTFFRELPQCQANASSAGILRGERHRWNGLITFHFNVNDGLFI